VSPAEAVLVAVPPFDASDSAPACAPEEEARPGGAGRGEGSGGCSLRSPPWSAEGAGRSSCGVWSGTPLSFCSVGLLSRADTRGTSAPARGDGPCANTRSHDEKP